jgi:SP family galactose:H+ symporter-like MFS transporter
VGFGPISWLLLSEIFPLRIRGMALSVGSLVNFGSNILVTLAFPQLIVVLGQVRPPPRLLLIHIRPASRPDTYKQSRALTP